MPIIKLYEASKLPGAPSQPFLSKITKEAFKYPFLRNTDKGWRVDTDDPAWVEYLAMRQIKNATSSPASETSTAKTEAASSKSAGKKYDEKADALKMSAAQASQFMVIQKAQKAEIDKKKAELELKVIEGNYIDKHRMIYYMGYFQRAITEGLDNLKRESAETEAVKRVCDKLKECVIDILKTLSRDEGIDL
jgi:hypothetical protein